MRIKSYLFKDYREIEKINQHTFLSTYLSTYIKKTALRLQLIETMISIIYFIDKKMMLEKLIILCFW